MATKQLDLRTIVSSTNPEKQVSDAQLKAIGQFLLKLYAEQ